MLSQGRIKIVTVLTRMEFTSGEYQAEMCREGSLQSATIHAYIHIQMFDYESRWITHQRLRRRLVVE